ncbi:hypothetical protein [Clostridium lacusfryxellense]|uniref:hypothetical protein n=1 Tax=Clostridium lacusfryxellense TaxID=205328 RepID=UPI001C0E78CC|nr:hypothetical protein [Clostridium lacusfryxellense]MBU3112814.1 hypothetical protein [Clostridium lacusfryxellense]
MSIYFLLLLIMGLLLYQGLISSLFYAPRKIKIISVIALILMIARYIALIILFVVKNLNYLYLLKFGVYTNFLCLPICGVISIMIFAKNNKIKLEKILFICAILFLVYGVVVYKSTSNINISNICGYTIELQFKDYFYVTLLIINSIFVIKGIELFNTSFSNKLGDIMVIIASCITLLSVILTSTNPGFEWLVMGDISWIITINYGLIKFKRRSSKKIKN